MKNKQGGTWDNLYPITLTENVFNATGKKIDDILSEMATETEQTKQDHNTRINDISSQISTINTELGESTTKNQQQDTAINAVEQTVNNLRSEKGSNENGHWIKRPDGTMVCWTTVQIGGDPNGPWGSLYYWYANPRHWTFPQPFIEAPTMEFANQTNQFLWGKINGRPDKALDLTGYRPVNTALDVVDVIVKATGRWTDSGEGLFFKSSDYPSYWESHITQKVNEVKAQENKNSSTHSFAFITDLHLDANDKYSFSIVKKMNKELNLSTVIVGGDLVTETIVGSKAGALRQIQQVVDGLHEVHPKTMTAQGNHDDSSIMSLWNQTIKPDEMYEKMFSFMGDAAQYGPSGLYHYRDNNAQKIRYIVLNSIDIPYIQVGTGLKYKGIHIYAYRQTQANWLINEALDTPPGWSVIISSHLPPYKEGVQAWDAPTYNEEIVRGILKAYKTKTTYSASSQTSVPDDLKISVNADFRNKGGDVIAFFCGHVHYDNVVQLPEGFPLITVLNDGGRRWLDSPQRVSGTIAEQAFDIATVNKNERKIYLTRVGAGNNRVVSY